MELSYLGIMGIITLSVLLSMLIHEVIDRVRTQKEDDGLNKLLIDLLSGNRLKEITENQVLVQIREQNKIKTDDQSRLVLEKVHYLNKKLRNENKLSDEESDELEYLEFLVEERGLA